MFLNDFSQAVRERILYNATALGELKDVLDRDEEPNIPGDECVPITEFIT